ncbi:peptidase U32 family protein [Paenibacillus larvae]|uniref:U32 family peptidase n=1 Tax=Paenibacillus larvae TaxID=1464 RepID=A0AAP5JVV1_9BACL|nr:U32 family peptidase [Paenibacillus larvae]AQR77550.1 protease [Paenibacillus larvae subsp. larvae]AVF21391.1 putative protease YrrO [Paenibacillus larvae subsp. larvae]ETK30179.1 putative protease YrrO [Paenibacillus larvae subsp. larvae DSM 25719]MCY7491318.1 U32 family peptidase [Paenibacillus larvae]MCY9563329.1 U32 family peptidase [Paenibacillus larvae]
MSTLVEARARAKRVRLEKPELLAPGGSLEKLKFAVHYGADAVYIGGQKYGLRSNADNFTFEEMKEGVEFARKYGAKVMVTTNIYAHNEDIEGLEDYLRRLEDVGIHAIIVADPLIMQTARRVAPKLELHVSTQQSITNWRTAKYWKNQGADRVVLAREVSMNDINEIKQKVDVEVEAFIHGAMCSSYSGRCVLSNHFTDRDSNRGGCCQSCRWKYDLYAKEQLNGARLASDIPLFDEEDDPFMMSAKDLCMIEHIPDMIESGVDSFKIEGRMKSLHYVATVVGAYRKAIDAYFDNSETYSLNQARQDEIYKAANRPLNTGFFYDRPGHEDHIFGPEDKAVLFDFAGVVMDYDPDTQIATIQQRNHFKPGQEVEFYGPGGTSFKQTVGTIHDEEGELLSAARHPLQMIKMKVDFPVQKWDMMRKRTGAPASLFR